ncbi:MAG: DoxX family protein [Thiofilum sp.]|uniref:DoxX family protein n=1 Tax=Thiofilum sp. TaxID=2212733 RepID=UPI0025DA428E|nr:DoxX family protein [Thiofilum sp.]MBK8455091.1 DoxX family protein [Thiofilum sp.]
MMTITPLLLARDHITQAYLQPLVLLVMRIYVAWVFFASGLTKIQSWSTTLSLFEDEYQVPLLSPDLAAYLATAGELVLPILLVLGLLSRLTALGLFILNAVAVLAYPYLWTIEGAGGFWQHVVWGVMLLIVLVYGAGRWSLDRWLAGRLSNPSS